jgi:hypothetical protein
MVLLHLSLSLSLSLSDVKFPLFLSSMEYSDEEQYSDEEMGESNTARTTVRRTKKSSNFHSCYVTHCL